MKLIKGKVLHALGHEVMHGPPILINCELEQYDKYVNITRKKFTEEMIEIHHFLAKKLPEVGKPISVEYISDEMKIAPEKITNTINELEKVKCWIYRSNGKEVTWVYPFTTDKTPHRITLSTGKQINSPCIPDSLAIPFVYSNLLKEPVSCVIDTVCPNSGKSIRVEVDSESNIVNVEKGASPVMFIFSFTFSKTLSFDPDKISDPVNVINEF